MKHYRATYAFNTANLASADNTVSVTNGPDAAESASIALKAIRLVVQVGSILLFFLHLVSNKQG